MSTQWAWTLGTRWRFRSDELFGPGRRGKFLHRRRTQRLLPGPGEGPVGSLGESFTQLVSITPEGNVPFNLLDTSGNPVSLAGLVTGGPLAGRMELRTYEFSGDDPSFGPLGIAHVVPEPGGLPLLAAAAVDRPSRVHSARPPARRRTASSISRGRSFPSVWQASCHHRHHRICAPNHAVTAPAIAGLFVWEHALARLDDPSPADRAFFTANAATGLVLLAAVAADLVVH